MGVVVLSFLAHRTIDIVCRLSTEVESMSYTDFSVGERKSGDAFKIRA